VAIGNDALSGNAGSGPALTTGAHNTAVGDSALYNAQGAAPYNIAIGWDALGNLATSTESTAVGALALEFTTTGPNSALGDQAGQYISTGASNTAVGYQTMIGVSATPLTGNSNTAIGQQALDSIQATGEYNTVLGYEAGYATTALTTGSSDTYIGYEAHGSGTTDTNEIVIGASATGNGSNTTTIGNSSTSGVYVLGLTTAGETDIVCYSTTSHIFTYETTVAGCVPSDIRIKNPQGLIDDADGLYQLRTAVFTYKDTKTYGAQQYLGLYA
jgi:hypothetical protein